MNISKKVREQLREVAINYQKRSYSPYSKIKVGASILSTNEEIFGGCNVENISIGGTICAERTAIVKGVSEGHNKFVVLYLYTKKRWSPCGMCLQVMSEFFPRNALVILGDEEGESTHTLEELFPMGVSKDTFDELVEI